MPTPRRSFESWVSLVIRWALAVELVVLTAALTMSIGFLRAQQPTGPSVDVLNERIIAAATMASMQNERITRTELAIARIDDRLFYLLIGVAGNLFAVASMVGMQLLAKRTGRNGRDGSD